MPALAAAARLFRVYVTPRMALVCAAIAGIGLLAAFGHTMVVRHGIPPWHNWFDQNEYLKSATGLANGDLSPDLHHYPPLYPLLAAAFIRLGPHASFFVVDLLVLLASVAMLVRMFASVIGSPTIAGLFAVGFLVHPFVLYETFYVPWTSTPATLFIIAALYCLMRLEQKGDADPKYSFGFGLALGLLVPTRPLDAVVALSLGPFWLWTMWRASAASRGNQVLSLASLGGGAAVGPIILLGFNVLVFGAPLSPYVSQSMWMFYWGNLPERFISIFIDSATLFIQPAQTLLHRFPWLTVGLCAMAVCIRYGPIWLRAAATAVALQFVLYLGYTDLSPNTLYGFLNYHYFRWALWLDFLMLPAAWVLLQRRFQARAWQPAALLLAFAAALACVQLDTREESVPVFRSGDRIVLDLPSGGRIDYVDIVGLAANLHTTATDPLARIDGRRLQLNRDIRAFQAIDGTRLICVRPLSGGRLELPVRAGWSLHAPLSARVGARSFTLGFPRSLVGRLDPLPSGALRLDGAPSDLLFAEGFSKGGDRRVIVSRQATLNLTLRPRTAPYRLQLSMIADQPIAVAIYLMNSDNPALTAEIGPQPRVMDLSIPPSAVRSWRATLIHIRRSWPADATADASPAITAVHLD